MDENTWLVAGLGNPGPGYSGNRHNVGQMVLDELAGRISASFKTHKANALVAEGRLSPGGPKLILAKPGTFMNLSGKPVAALLKFYSLDASRLIVIHDELDVPFDTVKLKQGGGHGGHNGLRDIIAAIGTPDFTRVRVGVGRPPGRQDAADFVLHDFSSTEKKVLPNLLADAADAAEHIVTDGLASAQLRFHSPS
ncbi:MULTISPECIES: aminoacyl-tRNA hydrolase [unclassified Leifsonia]|uniref:aminoacyl-tRNA hydrolase n=1 Tax=unclassified Leifsonia TaxID=2663824 RepID=UPI0006F3604A|nr:MULTISPECIES: aminoacyl-tRNA hydrolase [unclassified Leifsonia]KQX07481.1 peptidyl-tRNA hydrolase [Leifsonia sp. Root1293]KRA11763.1 peptidyl-tRNA hydrolase [Leifsonia sp. Root60]